MYQTVLKYQQNLSQFQMYGIQPGNAQYFVQPQLPIPLLSTNAVTLGKADGACMPPLFFPASINAERGGSPKYRNINFANPNLLPTDPYSCNFLSQLEGMYERELPDVQRVQVELVDGAQYANVRREDDTGELVVAQLIYEDEKRFRLCSLEGFVLAIMLKGKDMRTSVTWYSNDGSQVQWHRTGDVTFKLVPMAPDLSRRNSMVSNFSRTSQMSCSQASGSDITSDERMRIPTDLQTQEEPSREKEQTDGWRRLSSEQPSSLSVESQLSHGESPPASEKKLNDDQLFDQLKRHCVKCPSLVEKIINWGITRSPNRRVGEKEISKFAAGRIWVTAALIHPRRSTEGWQEVLSEFQGAYQEVQPGVFLQPPSQPNEPGKQHRIRKNKRGFWIIEEHNANEDAWDSCAQEMRYGHWVDLKNRRRKYNIQLVPMLNILNRMQEQWTDHDEMEKSIDFLCNSCNHKKLITTVKARNLKHNISNLQLKLEKQYALSFAVRVAEIADSVALEHQNVICIRTE